MAFCIHAELGWVENQEQLDILRKYGGVKGETVSRDILIPDAMPLWALHLVLQRSFGFGHNHMYSFEGEKGDFGTGMHKALDSFQVDYEEERMPIFPGGSFKRWMKRMYSGPYKRSGVPKVKSSLPLTYIYDFGDYWHIHVTKRTDFKKLPDIEKALETVANEKRPIQIAHDGDMLIDDVGNVDGFCRFLKRVGDIAPAVIEERNDWVDPEEMGFIYPPAYSQPEARHAGEGYLHVDEAGEPDEWGSTPLDRLMWAYNQGWHREDYTDFDLL